jgi:hypothetical protein
MRDLTKSVTSYTWAMSVFWTQQMLNLLGLGGRGSWDRSTRAFTNVTEATADEMGDTVRALFRGGDTLQRGLVDLVLAPFSVGNWCGGGRSRGSRDDGYSEEAHRGDWRDTSPRGWNDRDRRAGWADTAAGAAQAGADVLQAAVDTTARATQRSPQAVTPPSPPPAPAASDPSLGWGPMPR